MIKDGLRFFRLKAFLLILFSLISLFSFNSYAGVNDDLWQAAKEGNASKLAELVSSGADVNAKDNDDKTALSFANKRGHSEVAQLFKQAGASE